MAAIPSTDLVLLSTLIVILAVWIRRAVWSMNFRRTHPALIPVSLDVLSLPKVSIIVPARDETANISNCIDHLFKQIYPDFEIIVVDDRSADSTPSLLEILKRRSPVPFKIVRVEKLPQGWTGKNYAMFVGSKAAQGEWLLFTDADTTHSKLSLKTAMITALENKIDLLTLAPEIETRTFWEKTVQPLAVGSLALWFHSEKVNDPKHGVVLANGQFLLVRRDAYESVGGNESVRNEVIEDVELAKKLRAAGRRVQFLNGSLLYSTRMYTSLETIHRGWTRIFTYLFNKDLWRLLHKVLLFLIFSLLPFALFFYEFSLEVLWHPSFSYMLLELSLLVCGLIILIRIIGNRMLRTDPDYAFLHPLASLVMLWILFSCAERVIFKKSSPWRGDLHR